MHGLAVYVKEGLPIAQDLSLETSLDSYLRFWLALLRSLFYFFFLYRSSSLFLCMDFGAISSNVDEVLSINRSADVFVFGDYNIHLKVWLTYSGKTDRLVDSVIIFLSQMTFLRWLTFLIGSLTMTLTVLFF